MKSFFIFMTSFLFFLTGVSAQTVQETQKKEQVRLSGNINFSTQAVSPLLGSVLSPNPQLSGEIRAYYKGFGFSIYRSSDLVDDKSMANFFSCAPSYYKSFGKKWSLYSALHFEFYDKVRQGNLVAPYIVIGRKGVVNVDCFLGYGHFFSGGDLLGTILSANSSYQGYTLKISSANIYFAETLRSSFISEISKEIFPKASVGISYNLLNWNTDQKMSCGVVKLGYRF